MSSDHWWRKGAGNRSEVDYRIPFLVKAPSSSAEVSYDEPFNTVITRDLIGAIFRHDVTTQNDIADWIQQHHVDPPKSYDRCAAED